MWRGSCDHALAFVLTEGGRPTVGALYRVAALEITERLQVLVVVGGFSRVALRSAVGSFPKHCVALTSGLHGTKVTPLTKEGGSWSGVAVLLLKTRNSTAKLKERARAAADISCRRAAAFWPHRSTPQPDVRRRWEHCQNRVKKCLMYMLLGNP